MKLRTLEDLEILKKRGIGLLYPNKLKIMVGMGSCGLAAGAQETYAAIKEEIKVQNLDAVIAKTGCMGFCQMEPVVEILKPGWPRLTYRHLTFDKVKELIKALAENKIIKEWVLAKKEVEEDLINNKRREYPQNSLNGELKDIPLYRELPFYKKQKRLILRNCGFINPENIEEYIAQGGYFSLYKALKELKPEEIIKEIINSGLRGRGGAGFPTGKKWDFCRKAKGEIKYVICNADEGDPGAYMDRSILEGDPHSVLEGMIIGAYAIGANQGYVYVRNEYPLAVEHLKKAILQAESLGLLGENIFNSGFNFRVEIVKGAGAFVCGEETALLSSIEGDIGEPHPRPPFPAEKGLWGKPTNINNVKTWANIPLIIAKGADWFSKMGTKNSKGTMVFSLVGNIDNTGLVEVPMGIKLKELIYEIGGGIPQGKRFKAVQTGGPSGGCIPSSLIDLAVDYEELTKVGSMMGSGGMVVMDEDNCMVNVARYFLQFTMNESCGKCTPCREGIRRMLEILNSITLGKAKEQDLDLLEELASFVKESSLCGLGKTAPNPVLTTLHYFRDEYKTHILDKKCPAGVCRDLICYTIDEEKCKSCGLCVKECPQGAIFQEKKIYKIDQTKCIKCGICLDVCKFKAVKKE